ncbi:MAG: GNAT family N-acetyltransferase, partial [Bacteroidota bacterium]
GKNLMQQAAAWAKAQQAVPTIYLWVYAKNTAAYEFYKHIGGKKVSEKVHTNPDGSRALAYRMSWTLEDLVNY